MINDLMYSLRLTDFICHISFWYNQSVYLKFSTYRKVVRIVQLLVNHKDSLINILLNLPSFCVLELFGSKTLLLL